MAYYREYIMPHTETLIAHRHYILPNTTILMEYIDQLAPHMNFLMRNIEYFIPHTEVLMRNIGTLAQTLSFTEEFEDMIIPNIDRICLYLDDFAPFFEPIAANSDEILDRAHAKDFEDLVPNIPIFAKRLRKLQKKLPHIMVDTLLEVFDVSRMDKLLKKNKIKKKLPKIGNSVAEKTKLHLKDD